MVKQARTTFFFFLINRQELLLLSRTRIYDATYNFGLNQIRPKTRNIPKLVYNFKNKKFLKVLKLLKND